MKQIKRIEMKNLDLSLKQDDKYFYVYIGNHRGFTHKDLNSAMNYFDIVYSEYLKMNN